MPTVKQTTEFQAWLRSVTDPVAYDALVIRTVRMQSGLWGDVKPVGGKVTEARVDVGQGYRIYYTRRGLTIYLLVCGGDKSTQQAGIAKAKKMIAELDAKESAAAAKKVAGKESAKGKRK